MAFSFGTTIKSAASGVGSRINSLTATAPAWASAVLRQDNPQSYSLNFGDPSADIAQGTYDKKAKMAAIARSNAGTGTEYQSGFQYQGMEPDVAVQAGEETAQPEWKKAMARSYDLQRQKATAEQEGERVRMEERAKGRLAGQGFESGSGLQEKVLSNLDIESSKTLSGRLGVLDISEAAAMGDKQAQFDLATLQNDFATGRMTLAGQLEDENATVAATAESWFARGQAGEDIPADQLANLQSTNPRAYAAYQSGKAGKTREDWRMSFDRQTDYQNALIMRIDPSGPTFTAEVNDILRATGSDVQLMTPPPSTADIPQGFDVPVGQIPQKDLHDEATRLHYRDRYHDLSAGETRSFDLIVAELKKRGYDVSQYED